MRYIMCVLMMFLGLGYANAHEWTPTYPKFRPSYVSGVMVFNMSIYNSRKDVRYYSIGVFDKNFNPVRFATPEQIIELNYLERKNIDVYVQDKDVTLGMYICSESKILKDDVTAAVIFSRICSKVK